MFINKWKIDENILKEPDKRTKWKNHGWNLPHENILQPIQEPILFKVLECQKNVYKKNILYFLPINYFRNLKKKRIGKTANQQQ